MDWAGTGESSPPSDAAADAADAADEAVRRPLGTALARRPLVDRAERYGGLPACLAAATSWMNQVGTSSFASVWNFAGSSSG